VWWNDRFAALLGGDADRTRGRHLAEIVCRGTGDAARFEAAVAALGPAQHHRCGEARYEASGSAPREIEWTVAALRDADGPVTGYVGVGRDVTAENEARRARRRSEERFVEIVHNLPDRFWLYSIEAGEFVFASGRGPDLWGRELPAGPDALTKIVDFVHPEDRERLARIAARLLRDDDSALSEAEYRVLRPDGEIRWALTRVAPVRDERGKLVELVGLTLDVTVERETARALRERTIELERLLREKVVLLTEIHHRVKNNLQSISGLIHMLAARAHLRPLHETIEALEQRIQTMALVHETLYRSSDLAAVDMQSYLERITRMQIGAPDSTRLKVEIDVRASGVTLDLDSALRCGLIVNELVQNAVKHAFRGRKRGRIEVSMTRTGSRLVARVADDGIGLPAQLDLDSDATLGLRLVRGLAEQLGGTARRAPDAKSAIEIAIDLPG
jgi:PAS domain S-box-containing protein